jgi:hypothetical protein
MLPFRSALVASVLLYGDAQIHAQVLGVTFEGNVILRNDDSTEWKSIGQSGHFDLNALARSPSGSYVAYKKAPPARILSIHPLTGQSAAIAIPYLNDVRGLAFRPDGRLYAVDQATGGLYLLDLSVEFGNAAVKQLVGPLNLGSIQGLACSASGQLYGWSTIYGLVSIDATNGVCTDLNGLLDGHNDLQALAFRDDGRLYGFREQVYRLDPLTGSVTSLGIANGQDLRGAEFAPEWLPELEVSPIVALGTPIHVDIDAPPSSTVLLGVSPNHGPLCLGGLPTCLQLGGDPAAIVVAASKLIGMSGEIQIDYPTSPDPTLIGVRLYWQAVGWLPPATLSVSDFESCILL